MSAYKIVEEVVALRTLSDNISNTRIELERAKGSMVIGGKEVEKVKSVTFTTHEGTITIGDEFPDLVKLLLKVAINESTNTYFSTVEALGRIEIALQQAFARNEETPDENEQQPNE